MSELHRAILTQTSSISDTASEAAVCKGRGKWQKRALSTECCDLHEGQLLCIDPENSLNFHCCVRGKARTTNSKSDMIGDFRPKHFDHQVRRSVHHFWVI
ncbi:hypothetical protein [Sedimentitalea sp. HM32M-2]|uniref:hypothetical protein n=1 Tax=Sedimentitalea sp. HM32M-2 TaxID=3351566 RepID=UPI0036D3F68D